MRRKRWSWLLYLSCLVTTIFSSTIVAQVTPGHSPLSCDCPGCEAFLNGCDELPQSAPGMPPGADSPQYSNPLQLSPGNDAEGNSASPMETNGRSSDARESSLAAPPDTSTPTSDFDDNALRNATSPPQGLASMLGAPAGQIGHAPMIGDFFGIASSNVSASFRIAGSPLDVVTTFPSSGDSQWSVQRGIVTDLDGRAFFVANDPADFFGGSGPVTALTSGPVNFTTSVSGAEVLSLYNTGGTFARIPIVDDPQTNAFMQQQAQERFGSGGNLVFVASESGILAFEAGTAPALVIGGEFALPNPFYVYDYVSPLIFVPAPSAGGSVGRVRVSDNNSALPRDRVFFDYNFFHSVPLTQQGMDVNRFTPGFEKTFLSGLGSVEVRVPMALTLSSDIVADGNTELTKGELGNVTLVSKIMLWQDARKVIAAGMGVSLPTANDVKVGFSNGTQLARIDNEAVHLTPYLGMLVQRNSNTYIHGFLQLDLDTGGDTVYTNPSLQGLSRAGVWNDHTYLFADIGVGRWLVRNDCAKRGLSGVIATAEAHYTKSISSPDFIRSSNILNGSPTSDLDMLNGTIGTHFRWGQNLITTVGYSFPFTGDRVFEGEFRVFANRYF